MLCPESRPSLSSRPRSHTYPHTSFSLCPRHCLLGGLSALNTFAPASAPRRNHAAPHTIVNFEFTGRCKEASEARIAAID